MKVSITRIFALLTLTAACVAQPPQNFPGVELMSNPYPTDPQGYNFFPDADVTYASRAFRNDGSPIPGIPYHYSIKQYAGWGYHTHEVEHGTFISRHDPTFLSGQEGVTDANGFANANVELNGYAGGYTICAKFTDPNNVLVVLGERCVNNITRYYTGFGTGKQFLERYSGGLAPFDGSSVNQPQSIHGDARHKSAATASNNQCGLGGGPVICTDEYATRWVTHLTHLALLGASSRYKQNATIIGYPDMLDVTRASLPDGGVYDNDKYSIAPGNGNAILDWDTRVFEEHARGNEADIAISTTPLQSTQFEALYFANCKPGINEPTGGRISYNPPDPYWKTQGVVHVTCGGFPGGGLKKPIGR